MPLKFTGAEGGKGGWGIFKKIFLFFPGVWVVW